MRNTITYVADTKHDFTHDELFEKCKKIKPIEADHMGFRIEIPQADIFSAPLDDINDVIAFCDIYAIFPDSHNISVVNNYLYEDSFDETTINETLHFTITTR